MSDIRDWIPGDRTAGEPLLRSRKRKPRTVPSNAAEEESFADLGIRREAVRQANHRDDDRHRLDNATTDLLHEGRRQTVTLVNLSGGGAMIEGAEGLQLWDEVTLALGDSGKISAAVRWVRGHRIGLEFAQETRLDAGGAELPQPLRDTLRYARPDPVTGGASEDGALAPPETVVAGDVQQIPDTTKRELRHALIWSGKIHYDYETIPVRLRNISPGGALIECGRDLAVGSELLLELDKAGTFFATVKWVHGDIAGLHFQQEFDLQCLASARAVPAPARWVAPDYLRSSIGGSNPWERQPARGTASGQQQQRRIFRR